MIPLFPPKHPGSSVCIEPNPLDKTDDSVTKLGLGQNILWYNKNNKIGQDKCVLKNNNKYIVRKSDMSTILFGETPYHYV